MSKNKWEIVYYDLIDRLKESRPTGPYNTLVIKKYYKNESVPPYGWKYNRHHIKEIEISGAIYKDLPEYNTDESIILDYIEHYLIHYIIVMAETTMPNHGMLIPLINSGLSKLDAISAWDDLVIEGCKKYNIEYDEDWIYQLTLS